MVTADYGGQRALPRADTWRFLHIDGGHAVPALERPGEAACYFVTSPYRVHARREACPRCPAASSSRLRTTFGSPVVSLSRDEQATRLGAPRPAVYIAPASASAGRRPMPQVPNPIIGSNRFKLGLFCANCDGGTSLSTAP